MGKRDLFMDTPFVDTPFGPARLYLCFVYRVFEWLAKGGRQKGDSMISSDLFLEQIGTNQLISDSKERKSEQIRRKPGNQNTSEQIGETPFWRHQIGGSIFLHPIVRNPRLKLVSSGGSSAQQKLRQNQEVAGQKASYSAPTQGQQLLLKQTSDATSSLRLCCRVSVSHCGCVVEFRYPTVENHFRCGKKSRILPPPKNQLENFLATYQKHPGRC